LGAAYRLHELGHENFIVLEAGATPGGLACSVVDDNGFTWDMGECVVSLLAGVLLK
jgi:protoporphyrinogen oxidase